MNNVLDKAPLPCELREALEAMVIGDLLGPPGGPDEELTERNVRDRYLVGVLAPRPQAQPVPAKDEGLPVMVVDEEIYRRLPSLLIATVDKFAQMPWKGEVQMLFGMVTGFWERHGVLSPMVDDWGTQSTRENILNMAP